MKVHGYILAFTALLLCGLTLPAGAADIGMDLSLAKQSSDSRGRSDVTMGFLHLQVINRFHPHLEWVNEFTIGRMEKPEIGYIFGFNGVARVSIVGAGRTSPFIDLGAGVNHFGPHEKVRELTGPSQFSLVLGAGFRYRPKNKPVAFLVSYRFSHFSNAGTMSPNLGMNLHTVIVGFNFLPKSK